MKESFGAWLLRERTALGWTLVEVGERTTPRLSGPYLSQIQTGAYDPPESTKAAIRAVIEQAKREGEERARYESLGRKVADLFLAAQIT